MRRVRRGISALTAAAALIASVTAAIPAGAAAPTRVSDTVTEVYLEAGHADHGLDIQLSRSDTAGTSVYARLWGGPDGDHIAEGHSESVWTDSRFEARLELFDDDGSAAGTLVVSGAYTVAGDPERYEQKFNDGNVRVRMDHTTTPLEIDDVTVTLDGSIWPTSFAAGYHEIGHLFVSNPATYVDRGEFVAYGEARTENIEDFFLDGTLDDLGVGLAFADAEAHTAGAVDLSKGTWSGYFRLLDEGGEHLGDVAANAVLTRTGDPIRFADRSLGGYERWTYTPYELTLTVDGPGAPATLVVEIATIEYAIHTSPVTPRR